jgi:hypothetical protein
MQDLSYYLPLERQSMSPMVEKVQQQQQQQAGVDVVDDRL